MEKKYRNGLLARNQNKSQKRVAEEGVQGHTNNVEAKELQQKQNPNQTLGGSGQEMEEPTFHWCHYGL